MQRFSSEEDRHRVFDSLEENDATEKIQEGHWIDLYQLLGVAPDATAFEIDEAIIEHGADTVFFAFSGNGKPPHILQLEKYLPDMRAVLLDSPTRKRYNVQRALHEKNDPRARTYAEFISALDRREYSGCMSALLPLAALLSAGVFRYFTA